MTIARRGLKVKVKAMDQANAIGPTSIKDSFSSSFLSWISSNRLSGDFVGGLSRGVRVRRPTLCEHTDLIDYFGEECFRSIKWQ